VLELTFTVDCPWSTEIYDSGGPDEIIYYVGSSRDPRHRITIVQREERELARLHWHESSSDEVQFAGGLRLKTRMNTWMKSSFFQFADSGSRSFTDVKGGKYTWKHVSPDSESMELWSSDIKIEPIAKFQKSLPAIGGQASLLLSDRALEIQDLAVISFLFLEKENKIRAKNWYTAT